MFSDGIDDLSQSDSLYRVGNSFEAEARPGRCCQEFSDRLEQPMPTQRAVSVSVAAELAWLHP